MKILRIRSEGFRGLPDRVFDFAAPGTSEPHALVFVTGSPASGKTSLLEAIIAAKEDVGAYGARRSSGACVRSGARIAQLDATWLLSPAERASTGLDAPTITTTSIFGETAPPVAAHPEPLRALFEGYSRDPARAKVEYFHAERALPPTRGLRHGAAELPESSDARVRLTRNNEKFRAVRAHLVTSVLAGWHGLAEEVRREGVAVRAGRYGMEAELRELLSPSLHEKVFDGIDPEGEGYRVRFRRCDGSVIDLDELSTSEQQGVLVAVTFRRLGLSHSVVLIDGPELHVHPRDVPAHIAHIATLGRDNQIIAATTAPELLRGATKAQVIEL
jgi:hypothetical protein